MSRMQRITTRLAPDPAEIQAQTRKWEIRCPDGHSKDLWEAGGVRYRATGSKQSYGYCSKCGRRRMLRIVKKTDP